MLVQNRYEPVIMPPFQQVRQLVDNDVFQTSNRLLGQFQVEPDAMGRGAARTPLGLHPLDANVGYLRV
jgi:hypothetical protein